MSIDGQRITQATLGDLFDQVQGMLDKTPVLVISVQEENTGKWGMARLWRRWMATTAQFMAARGCTQPLYIDPDGKHHGSRPFGPEDAHELFTAKWLGVGASGERLSWSKQGRDGMRPANKGERFHALRQHENWCTEKGIALFNPRYSEYQQLQQEENA